MKFAIDKKSIRAIPKIALLVELYNDLPEKVIRWVIYRFDPESPIWDELKVEAKDRKAIELAGIKAGSEEYKAVTDREGGKFDRVNEAISMFLKINRNATYEAYVNLEVGLDDVFRRIRTPITGAELGEDREQRAYLTKIQLMEKIPNITNRMNDLLDSITMEDERAKTAVKAGAPKRLLSPEDYARN